jgi:DNA-binding XRE family transcriptional regulator
MTKKIRFPKSENRRFVLANRDDPPIDSLSKKNPPPVDLLEIREEIIQHLESGTSMHQIDVAELVGIRRETISAIKKRRAALTDIVDVNRLYRWMWIDRQKKDG